MVKGGYMANSVVQKKQAQKFVSYSTLQKMETSCGGGLKC